MNENTKMNMKKVLNYAKNIVLSLVVLFAGLVLIPIIVLAIFLKIADPVSWSAIAMLAPVTIDNWFVNLVISFFTILPSVVFIIWIVRDSRKFKSKGVNTDPFLWGVGMVFPLILVAFPFYFIRRNITWLKEKKEMISASGDRGGLRGWYNMTNSITENTKIKINKGLNVLKWTAVILVGAYGLLFLFRIPFFIQNKSTTEQVAKIHATKLTMDDVMGKYLPADPGANADKTIAGIDANTNGIRDDVELAIFKEYPNSAKTRAVLLQYALVLQMVVTQPFENEKNVTEVVREKDRAHTCVGDTLVPSNPESGRTYAEVKKIDMYDNFVDKIQFNTDERKKAKSNFYENLRSFGPLDEVACDIDLSTLPN